MFARCGGKGWFSLTGKGSGTYWITPVSRNNVSSTCSLTHTHLTLPASPWTSSLNQQKQVCKICLSTWNIFLSVLPSGWRPWYHQTQFPLVNSCMWEVRNKSRLQDNNRIIRSIGSPARSNCRVDWNVPTSTRSASCRDHLHSNQVCSAKVRVYNPLSYRADRDFVAGIVFKVHLFRSPKV